MQTFINQPEKTKFKKLSSDPLETETQGIFDDLEEGVCGGLDGLMETLGCSDPDPSILCSLFGNLGAMLGCGEFECDSNEDCEPPEVCTNHSCILPSGACEVDADCFEPLEECVDDECELVEGSCYTKDDCGPDPAPDEDWDCINNECEACGDIGWDCSGTLPQVINGGAVDCCEGLVCDQKNIIVMDDDDDPEKVKKQIIPTAWECCIPNGSACSTNPQCCSGFCNEGSCVIPL